MSRKRRKRRNAGRCPCGSTKGYAKCCAPFLGGDAVPETPVELMRSRYSAYARGKVDYIVETTDPEGDAWDEPVERIRRFSRDTRFLGVEILESRFDETTGEVQFYAELRSDGRDVSFAELSHFVRRDGRWLYTSGEPVSKER